LIKLLGSLLVYAAFIGAWCVSPVASAYAASPIPGSVQAAAADRLAFGLPSDIPSVQALLDSGSDTGSLLWGIPMTDEEAEILDLPGRMAFANAVHERLVPFVTELEEFGGAYFDQADGGGLVVSLTAHDPAVQQAIRDLVPPDPSRGVEITFVALPLRMLEDAAQHAWDAWRKADTGAELINVAVDTRHNRLRLEIAGSSRDQLAALAPTLRLALGVPIELVPGNRDSDIDATCTRSDCIDPMRSGIVVWHQKDASHIGFCTMGFHIVRNGDKQFLTAGHCGYSGSNDWYHDGYLPTKVGSELSTLYASWGKDAMRVQLPDAQASDDVFGASTNIVGSRNPLSGEAVCASLGIAAIVDCGTVSDDHVTWTDQICGCTIQGADANGLAIVQGDSGSPVFSGTIGGAVVAVGLVDTTGGKFARLQDVLSDFGATIHS
jgi:hypothetical protein